MVIIGIVLALGGMAIAVFSSQKTVGLVLTVVGIVFLLVGLLTGDGSLSLNL